MEPRRTGPFLIYNLFPRLAGPVSAWEPHVARAAAMGFEWLLLNPIQRPGASNSVYAIRDFHDVDPLLLDPSSLLPPWQQIAAAVAMAHRHGLRVIVDLVVQHAAVDSPLIGEHPEWFRRDENGSLWRPGVEEGGRRTRTWEDLAALANATSKEREALWDFWRSVVDRLLATGADGLRAHMAHEAPGPLWRALLAHIRAVAPGTLVLAETLGCPDWQTVEVARLGFDACFNSSKWWDFQASWCLDQYRATAPVAPTIGFPEAHDTPRLMADLDGDVHAVKQRYAFTALFSSGVMIPMGFEYGVRRPIDAFRTTAADWETPTHDLRAHVAEVNAVKRAWPVFGEDGPVERVPQPGAAAVVLQKRTRDGSQRGLLVLNADRHHPTRFALIDLRGLLAAARVREVTPGRTAEDVTALLGEVEPAGCRVYVGA
jgi:starch synthase (maltosyl-transferring)